ncbi:hypothetical protein [uncultured Alsobacter sp.]|uniref:hypothetical protein n=1 Tax=uncultured Alsobacter sp. TaxID=1748258 RepID=UPI0025F8723D|nr:hypothetical protein [uncultured Alsobacter sp.]
MKLASLDDGSPEGLPVVVSRDLSRCTPATSIVTSLLDALCTWEDVADRLRSLAARLEAGRSEAWRFHEAQAVAPVPEVSIGRGILRPLGAARSALAQSRGAGPLVADLSLAALCDPTGRARLLVPLVRLTDERAPDAWSALAAPVAMTADELDDAADARQPVLATLQVVSDDEARLSRQPLPAPMLVRSSPGYPGASLAYAADGLCRLQARTRDRVRAVLKDPRGHPVAGVIELTLDPPAPRMAPPGLSRPPLRERP